MAEVAALFLRILGSIILLGLAGFSLVSFFEKEHRAARVALAGAVLGGGVFWGAAAAPQPLLVVVFWLVAVLLGCLVALFFLPIGVIIPGNDIPRVRFDERQIMFARARLQPGTPDYQSYYTMHPDHEVEDNTTREKPGLLSPRSKFAHPFHFASVEGSFYLTDSLREAVNGPVSEKVQEAETGQMTRYVKDLARFYGAKEVGITPLQPYHVYSHVGRGTGGYGELLRVEHAYAIAFTVEMDYKMVGTSPYPPTTMETGKQYVESARVAVQLAGAIRALGYPARAHIDGNYRVIAPLVARDAGLGEIGRMTLLMTPRQGPRVRLGVVTTDLALVPDIRKPDAAVIDFCTICEKCARVCPSRSIPFGPRQEIDGALRWKLNPDTCFRYWNVIGTDCARCMSVCPFSHPDTFSHNLVRWGIARSGFFRRSALQLDDLFYGRKPRSKPGPDWVDLT
jgi:ferredoxin